jgi:hypothetical protein
MEWAFNVMHVLVLGTAKLSVIFFYRRIFRGKIFDVCSIGLIGIVCAWTVSFFFAILFECGTNFWALFSTLNDFLMHCSNETVFLKVLSISDVIIDGLILALPVPIVSSERGLDLKILLLTGVLGLETQNVFFSQVSGYSGLFPRCTVSICANQQGAACDAIVTNDLCKQSHCSWSDSSCDIRKTTEWYD